MTKKNSQYPALQNLVNDFYKEWTTISDEKNILDLAKLTLDPENDLNIFTGKPFYENSLNIPLEKLTQLINTSSNVNNFYLTLFKIFVTPENILREIITKYSKDAIALAFFVNVIKLRQKELKEKALLISSFRNFLFNNHQNLIKQMATDFKDNQDFLKYIHPFKSQNTFINFILENADFDNHYRKQLFINFFNELILKSTTVFEVMQLVDELDKDQYKKIRDREENNGYSFWGYTHKGKPVSATFSEIMEGAKTRILEILKGGKKEDFDMVQEGKPAYLFLNEHRYATSELLSFLFKRDTHSAKILENLKATTPLLVGDEEDGGFILIPTKSLS